MPAAPADDPMVPLLTGELHGLLTGEGLAEGRISCSPGRMTGY